LGELYFQHLCEENRYAYIRLWEIYHTLTPKAVLEFKLGFDRVPVKIPAEILEELRTVCQPLDINGSPSYVFDFLTCRMPNEYYVDRSNLVPASSFHWVEVKTGKSQLSRHQQKIREQCGLQFDIFRVENVDDSPHNVRIRWEEADEKHP